LKAIASLIRKQHHVLAVTFSIVLAVAMTSHATAAGNPLRVSIAPDKKEIVVGERLRVKLTLENKGRKPIEVNHPEGQGGMPDFRLRNVQSGERTLFKKKTQRGSSPFTIPIAPGKRIVAAIAVPETLSLDTPGTYELSAIVAFNNGQDTAESQPTRVIVRPVNVYSLYTGIVQGSQANTVFVNGAVNPHEIGLARFELSTGGGVMDVFGLGATIGDALPYLSLPPHMAWANGTWIAWIDNQELLFAHFSEIFGATGISRKKLNCRKAEIVPPLYTVPGADEKTREQGSALLWMQVRPSEPARLQRIDLNTEGKTARADFSGHVEFPAVRPDWMTSLFRSNGDKLAAMLFPQDGQLSLQIVSWPQKGRKAEKPMRLAKWDGKFLAGHAIVGPEDIVYGAFLLQTGSERNGKLELVGWLLDKDGRFKVHYRQTIPVDGYRPIGNAIVRARRGGNPAALLQSGKRKWQVWNGKGQSLEAVAEPWGSTQLPMDMAFSPQGEILLICSKPGGGLAVKKTDGSDLPSFDELKSPMDDGIEAFGKKG